VAGEGVHVFDHAGSAFFNGAAANAAALADADAGRLALERTQYQFVRA
jgi:hypothetical protein